MNRIKKSILMLIASIPDQLIPDFAQKRIIDIAEKELQKTKADVIKLRWQQVKLENQLKEYKAKQ